MVKIKNLSINGIGVFDKIDLSFNPGVNIICGPNGVGKTTILECISHSFLEVSTKLIKRNSNYKIGNWELSIINNENTMMNVRNERSTFHPSDPDVFPAHTFSNHMLDLLVFKSSRELEYIEVTSIEKDPKQEKFVVAMETSSIGTVPHNIKSWFLHRYLWSAHEDGLEEYQTYNLQLAIKCFSLIDEKVTFKKVVPDTNEILLNAYEKNVYFEYLSSGYKSILVLLLGIIKQIEYRFKNPGLKVTDFNGIILIDEVDLHIHPQWQSKLVNILRKLVPNAQIIITTHSPHIIQSANPNEIIALGINLKNNVYLRDLPSSKYGYNGWTIEEILLDVMGLEETKSPIFISFKEKFDFAIDEENIFEAGKIYKEISQMLHPNNTLKKILEIQLASIGGTID